MTLLTLDRGNSTLDCRLEFEGGVRRLRLDPAEEARLWAWLDPKPEAVVGLTVVEGGLDTVAERLGRYRIPLLLAGRELRCPLQLCYRDPARLGVDRWVAAVAARARHGDAVVVDCGSAVTVDAVTAAGAFLGGAIAPGAEAMRAGLAARAARLPSPDLAGEVVALPRDTEAAVRSGLVHAFCGAVERLVDEVAAAAGFPALRPVLTGGEAELYLAHGRLRCHHEPELVHDGLRALWQVHR